MGVPFKRLGDLVADAEDDSLSFCFVPQHFFAPGKREKYGHFWAD